MYSPFGTNHFKIPSIHPSVANHVQGRNHAVELLRFVCAVGIVWFHMGGPYAWIGHAGLHVFVALSVFYALENSQNEVSKTNVWHRAKVLKIWGVWCLIYALLKIAQAVAAGNNPLSEFELWMLFTGPSLPLWFLPFIYLANGVAVTYLRSCRDVSPTVEAMGLAAATAACIALASAQHTAPMAQWNMGLIAVFIAIALFRAHNGGGILQLAMVASLTLFASLLDQTDAARMALLATVLCTACLLMNIEFRPTWATRLGHLSLGLYLLHSGVAAVLKMAVPDLQVYYLIGATVAASSALAFILRRTPVLRNFI